MKNFWTTLKKPFFVLAPMADVTDWPFRQVIKSAGKPDVFFTEFVSAEGLASIGRDKLMPLLHLTDDEHPIVAQFFSARPENIFKAARLAKEFGFDGVDINMGCPDRKIIKQGCGAAMIENPSLAKEIIYAAKEGANDIPVSVKTRIGFHKIETDGWISILCEAKPDVISIHGRTMKEMSHVPAHWDEISKASEICHKSNILAVGNGDIESHEDGIRKANEYGLDGIMIGRGIFNNPWIFNPDINPGNVKPEDRIVLLRRHIELFHQFWGEKKNYATLKRFFKIYVTGWEGAKNLRMKLMNTNNISEAYSVIDK